MTSTSIGDTCGEGHTYQGIFCDTCALIDEAANHVQTAIASTDIDERQDSVGWLLGNLPNMTAEVAEQVAIEAGLLEGPQ